MSLDDQQEQYLNDTKQATKAKRENQLREFGENLAVVIVEGRTKIAYLEFDSTLNNLMLKFSDRQSMTDFFANKSINVSEGGAKKVLPIFPYWLKSRDRKTYKGVRFKPTKGTV